MTQRPIFESPRNAVVTLILNFGARLLTAIALAVLATACSTNNEGEGEVNIDNDQVSLPLPVSLATTTLPISNTNLFVELTLTNTATNASTIYRIAPIVIDNNTNTVSGTLTQVPVGDYSIDIRYVFNDGTYGEIGLIKFTPQPIQILENGQSTIDMSIELPIYIDTDQDGHSNLSELEDVAKPSPLETSSLPGNPTAIPKNVGVKISNANNGEFLTYWQAVAGIDSYGVHMGNTPGITTSTAVMNHNNKTVAQSVSGFGHGGLGYGVPWYIVATSQTLDANNNLINSIESSEVFVEARAVDPAVPNNISIEAGDGQNIIRWDPPDSGANAYTVYFSTDSTVSQTSLKFSSEITATSYTHTGLQNGVMYFYVVTATSNTTQSPDSSKVGATPYGRLATPTLSATEEVNTITLSWSTIPGAVSYSVYMASDLGGGVTVDRVERGILKNDAMTHTNITGVTFTHPPPLVVGREYFFRVFAVDKYGRYGLLSAEVSATPF